MNRLEQIVQQVPQTIANQMRTQIFLPGETIIFPGQSNERMYIFIEGQASMCRNTSCGEQVQIHVSTPYTFAGEMECFLPGIQSTEVTALTRCKCLVLPYSALMQWMEIDVRISYALIEGICHRTIKEADILTRMMTMSVDNRILDVIAAAYTDGSIKSLTKNHLCVGAYTPIRSVNRSIKKWKEMGWIDFQKKEFSVLQPKKIFDYLQSVAEKEWLRIG